MKNLISSMIFKIFLLECFMDFTERRGGDIKHLTRVANASNCREECQANTNCSVWTYLDGRCYMKNEKTFEIKTDGLVSGLTNCSGEGILSKN